MTQDWAFVLLGLAIVLVWAPSVRLMDSPGVPPWTLAYAAALALALMGEIVTIVGLAALLGLATLAYASVYVRAKAARAWLPIVTVLLAMAMGLHLVPGFHNPRLYDQVRFSPSSAPFTQYLNFDKGSAGLILLAAYAKRARSIGELRHLLSTTALVAIGTSVVVTATAVMIGYTRPDFKLPIGGAAFLAANLLFVCVAEEVLFRGVFQERLHAALDCTRVRGHACLLAVAGSGMFFGLADATAGAAFAASATLAGMGYALAYALTRRIEAPILTHFAVNAVHFVGFSYPYIAR